MSHATKDQRDRQFRAEALRWLPEVTRDALSLTRDEADADDLVQHTFFKAYEAWGTYAPGTECRGWLFTICRHTFLRTRGREARHASCDDPALAALAAVAVHAAARQGGYGDLFARFDLGAAIDRAIAALPEAFREVVLLVDVHALSYEMAAGALGVSMGTVRSRRAPRPAAFAPRGTARGAAAGVGGGARLRGGDARAVMRELWDYLDGERTPERMAAIRAHLEVCKRCYPQYEFEHAFLDALAARAPQHSRPEQVHAKVLGALRAQGLTAE